MPTEDEIVLDLSYATADEVPAAFKSLYVEKDGVHNLNLTRFKGVKTEADVNNISRALTNEKNNHKELRTKWGAFFGDKKPEDVQAMLDRYPELEQIAANKIDDKQLNELAEQRAKTRLAPLERNVQTLTSAVAERDNIIAGYKQAETRRTIHDEVRGFATKSKVVATAVEDVLMLAENVFEIAEDGKVITKDNIKGVPPGLSPEVWLQEMQKARPHWWPPSSGGGGSGGGGGGGFGGGDNPWSATGWNMTKQGQIMRESPDRAKQMATAAGTTIGGARPALKK